MLSSLLIENLKTSHNWDMLDQRLSRSTLRGSLCTDSTGTSVGRSGTGSSRKSLKHVLSLGSPFSYTSYHSWDHLPSHSNTFLQLPITCLFIMQFLASHYDFILDLQDVIKTPVLF